MKRNLFLLLILFPSVRLKAQSYKKLTDSALHIMWDAKDTVGYRKALNLYEKAFLLYPKDVNEIGFYKAAVLSGELKENDKAFNFLNKLLAVNTSKNTTWNSLTSEYTKEEYANLLTDKRWPVIVGKAQKLKNDFFKNLSDKQREFQEGGLHNISFKKTEDGKSIYKKIKNFNAFTSKVDSKYSIKFKVTDSLNTSYFVSLPKGYNPKKSYTLLFFLHGAVQYNNFTDFQTEDVMGGWNRFYTKYAALDNVIMVYPNGSKKYNWMNPDDGFFMIPAILKEIKQSINIDDDKIFITGHSNGATGSFSYLMKQQSPFAGFYGFNTQPKVRNGGTFLRNIANRSYFNVSTDEDYYYPPNANDSLNVIMTDLIADYQDHRYIGWPHWFPQFDESEPVYPMIFRDISGRKRNSFQPTIYWECDDVKYGKADWVQINQLDTPGKSAPWKTDLNFNISKLLAYDTNKNLITKDTLLKAFSFPRKSGAVKASFSNNEFHLETSNVKSLSILISPEMVDVNKPVTVFVDGVKKLEEKVKYNRDFLIKNFKETMDRKAIWINKINITL